MKHNVMRRLLLIKTTEIVEVTETITVLIENAVLDAGQGPGYISPVDANILKDTSASNWVQPALNKAMLNISAIDVITPLSGVIENMNIEERPSTRRKK